MDTPTPVRNMNWFSNNNKADVHRTINRILNSTVSIESHMAVNSDADKRDDIRVPRTMPVVILPLADVSEDEQITVGLTQDLSCEGMALVTLGPLPIDTEMAVGIADGESFTVLLCESRRREAIGFGFYESGVHIKEVLPAKDFMPLREFADYLETNPPKSILSMVSASSFHQVDKATT